MKTLLLTLLLLTATYPDSRDKLHVGVSFTLSMGAYGVLKDLDHKERVIHSALFSSAIGVTKEYVDYRAGGKFDNRDLLSNLLGISLALLTVTLIGS